MARVLVTGFCAVPGPRRSGVQLRHVVRALTSLHTVDLLVVREGDQGYVERQGAVRVLRVPMGEGDFAAQTASFQRALRRQLDGAEYDVIHCVDPWSADVVLELKARLEVVVVYDAARSPRLDGDAAQLHRQAMAKADLVLVPDAAMAEICRRELGALGPVPPIHISPVGVDVDRFDWDLEPAASEAAKLVVVGELHAELGLETLIDALARLEIVPAPLLLLAGSIDADYRTRLLAHASGLGLADRVEFLGVVDHEQVPALLASATLCIAPGCGVASEGHLPTKLMEYWACKRAAVVSSGAVASGTATDDAEVVFYQADDVGDLAGRLSELLGDPVRRKRIADQGYQRVRCSATASAARRELRNAYAMLGQAFANVTVRAARSVTSSDDSVRLDVGIEDDFDVTVFEQAPTKAARDCGKVDSAVDVIPSAVRAVAGEIGESNRIARDDVDDDMSTGAMQLVDPEELNDDERHADELDGVSEVELEELSELDLVEMPSPERTALPDVIRPVRVSTPPPFLGPESERTSARSERGHSGGTQPANEDDGPEADTGEVRN